MRWILVGVLCLAWGESVLANYAGLDDHSSDSIEELFDDDDEKKPPPQLVQSTESCCCDGAYNSYKWDANGHEYKFIDCVFPWAYARRICRSWGGYLVNINNEAENRWIRQQLDYRYGDDYGVWTGLWRPNCHSKWRWDGNGHVSGWTNWLDDSDYPFTEPNCNYKPHELVGLLIENWYWADTEGTLPLKVICEREKTPSPPVDDSSSDGRPPGGGGKQQFIFDVGR